MEISKAPVVEAIINLSIAPSVDLSLVKQFQQAVADAFPISREILTFTQRIEGGEVATSENRPIGWQLRNSDSNAVCQPRVDGFSYHHLPPYNNWQTFLGEAQLYWGPYRQFIGKEPTVTGFSIRYINKLDLPQGQEISEFLATYPQVSPGLPQALSQYSMHLVLNLPGDPSGTLSIRQARVGPESSGSTAGVFLDLEIGFPVSPGLTDEAIWKLIDSRRDMKNSFFLACLTTRLKDMIK